MIKILLGIPILFGFDSANRWIIAHCADVMLSGDQMTSSRTCADVCIDGYPYCYQQGFFFFSPHLSDFPCAVLTCLWNSSGSSSHSSHFSLPPLLLLSSFHFSRSNFKAVANTPHCLVLGGWQLIWGRGWRLAARPECPVACSLECMEYYLSLNMGNSWNDDLWCTLTLQYLYNWWFSTWCWLIHLYWDSHVWTLEICYIWLFSRCFSPRD